MSQEIKNEFAYMDFLFKDYQSLWTVDLKTGKLTLCKMNEVIAIPGTIQYATEKEEFECVRQWYIQNYIVEEHRKRVERETQLDKIVEGISNGDTYVVEYRRIYNNTINYNQLYFAKAEEENGQIVRFYMGFRDVDSMKREELDDLTGLFTRKSFIRHAEELIAKDPDISYSILLSDFVDFKEINEKYGIKIGDEIIKCAAKQFRSSARHDLMVGRYGGDQFALLIKTDELRQLIQHHISYELDFPPHLPKVVVKYGIFERITKDMRITVACDCAHIAVNSIKHTYGQSYAFYDNALSEALKKQRIIEKDMHQALAEGQFKVFYQPKHDTKTGKMVGAEALIRWIHPVYGFMSPADFIPLFEKNGFIAESDLYVYRRTCENLKRWTDLHLHTVPISVNASKVTFENRNVEEEVSEMLSASGISPDLLHIEITESLMSDDVDDLINRLSALRNKGIRIELDDFGAGYSSINMLSMLPLDVIKLDMCFMEQLKDPKRAKVLQACVDLAKNLGYSTVSEGVETFEQHEFLTEMGVDVIQGYYYSKPLSEEEFEKYLRDVKTGGEYVDN